MYWLCEVCGFQSPDDDTTAVHFAEMHQIAKYPGTGTVREQELARLIERNTMRLAKFGSTVRRRPGARLWTLGGSYSLLWVA